VLTSGGQRPERAERGRTRGVPRGDRWGKGKEE
jgi:hypothetical protein